MSFGIFGMWVKNINDKNIHILITYQSDALRCFFKYRKINRSYKQVSWNTTTSYDFENLTKMPF